MAPMISADNRLFDVVEKPQSSRTVSGDNGNGLQSEKARNRTNHRRIRPFPSGTTKDLI